ncbi:MAG: hypothetical protein AAF191_00870 [Verrucomicrobiota bacterium]
MKKTKSPIIGLLAMAGLVATAMAETKVGIVEFEEKDAPGLSQRVRGTLAETFRGENLGVVTPDGATIEDNGGAAKLARDLGVDWIVTGRVVGGKGITFIVAKAISKSGEVKGDALQIRDPSQMQGELKKLAKRLVEIME